MTGVSNKDAFNMLYAGKYSWEDGDIIKVVGTNYSAPINTVFAVCALHNMTVDSMLKMVTDMGTVN